MATNVFLRRLHNFALDMSWLPWPVLAKKQWPKVRFKEKRAITWKEHQAIITSEMNPERRAFYEFCWHLGGAQSDVASLTAEDIDWQSKVVSFLRHKTGTVFDYPLLAMSLGASCERGGSGGALFPNSSPGPFT